MKSSNIRTILFFSVLLFGIIFTGDAKAAPLCGATGFGDLTDPACYTSSSTTTNCTWNLTSTPALCDSHNPWIPGVSVATPVTSCAVCSMPCRDNVNYADSCTGNVWCTNAGPMPPNYTLTTTTTTCHYIDAVTSWSACAGGTRVATSAHWTTTNGTNCSNVPLIQTCGLCGVANGGSYAQSMDIQNSDKCMTGNASAVSANGVAWDWDCLGDDGGDNLDDVSCSAEKTCLDGNSCITQYESSVATSFPVANMTCNALADGTNILQSGIAEATATNWSALYPTAIVSSSWISNSLVDALANPGGYTATHWCPTETIDLTNTAGITKAAILCKGGVCDNTIEDLPITSSVPALCETCSCPQDGVCDLNRSTNFACTEIDWTIGSGYCSQGTPDNTPSFPVPVLGAPVSVNWNCEGAYGSVVDEACIATIASAIPAVCGLATTENHQEAPTSGFCMVGSSMITPPGVTLSGGSWRWKCQSICAPTSVVSCQARVTVGTKWKETN